MKKLLFLSLLFLSISACAKPLNPEIIGHGTLTSTPKDGSYFVEIGEEKYDVEQIWAENLEKRGDKIVKLAPTSGVEVTLFKSRQQRQTICVMGNKNVEELEEMFQTNTTGKVLLRGISLLAFFAFLLYVAATAHKWDKKEKTTTKKTSS